MSTVTEQKARVPRWSLVVWWVLAGVVGAGLMYLGIVYVARADELSAPHDGGAHRLIPWALAITVGGVSTSVLHWLILRRYLSVSGVRWVLASAIGLFAGGFAGIFGGVLIYAFLVMSNQSHLEPVASLFLGATLGVVLGTMQWTVLLRSSLSDASWWIVSSAVGWSLAAIVILTNGSSRPVDPAALALAIVLPYLVNGVVMLVLLRKTARESPDEA